MGSNREKSNIAIAIFEKLPFLKGNKSHIFDVSNNNKLQLFFEKKYILQIDEQKPLITGDDIFFAEFNAKCFREDQFIRCFNNYGGFINLDASSGNYTISMNRIVDGPDSDDPAFAFGKCEKF